MCEPTELLKLNLNDIQCSLCKSVLESPVTTPCGHVYCNSCLSWIMNNDKTCCVCSRAIDINSLQLSNRSLSGFVFPCEQCNQYMTLTNFQNHYKTCTGRQVLCTRGCNLPIMDEPHDCISALSKVCSQHKSTSESLHCQMKRQKNQFTKREKVLLQKISGMQSEMHRQSLKFQRKIGEMQNLFDQISSHNNKVHFSSSKSETFDVSFSRHENGTLGFSIAGGKTDKVSSPIFIAKIFDPIKDSNVALRANDIIQEVNGIDLRKATHEEAVEAFKSATSLVQLKILREEPLFSKSHESKRDFSTQTDLELDYPNGFPDLLSLPSLTDLESVGLQDLDFGDLMLTEGFRPLDVHYEEVKLSRQNTNERLGLTICLGPEETVFISNIQDNSIASRCPNLSKGDAIIQINGRPISKPHDVSKIFSENVNHFTLLISRPHFNVDEFFSRDLLTDIRNLQSTSNVNIDIGESCKATTNKIPLISPIYEEINKTDSASEHGENKVSSDSDSSANLHNDNNNNRISTKKTDQWTSLSSSNSSEAELPVDTMKRETMCLLPTKSSKDSVEHRKSKGKAASANTKDDRSGRKSGEKSGTLKKSKQKPNKLEEHICFSKTMGNPSSQYHEYLQYMKLKENICKCGKRDSSPNSEWKVKIRADGTRYITKANVTNAIPNIESKKCNRERVLKKRADRINTERDLFTTDDDTLSEIKVGKYWSRQERKRQFLMARDRKLRKELLIKSHTLREDENAAGASKVRAGSKRNVAENYLTFQEVMNQAAENPLLSVTTV